MIQQDNFFDKKFCMQTIQKNATSLLSMINVERPKKGETTCPKDTKSCGGGDKIICLPESSTCPINSVKLLTNSEARSFTDKVAFGPDHSIVFKSDADASPIVNIRIEPFNPCVDQYFFQAGLNNQDNSIYQQFDFNFFIRGRDFDTEVNESGPEFMDLFVEKVAQVKRQNKCPYDENVDSYFNLEFEKANEAQFPLSLLDIMDYNSLKDVLSDIPGYAEEAYKNNSAVFPDMYVKGAEFTDASCDMPSVIDKLFNFQIKYFRQPLSLATSSKVWLILLIFFLAFAPFIIGILFSCISVISVLLMLAVFAVLLIGSRLRLN